MLKIKEVRRGSKYGKQLMKDIYALRYEVFSSLGWISDSRTKMIKDEFDESTYTTHFALIEDDKVIGAHRMTKYSESQMLPFIKEKFNPSIFKIKKINTVSEATRLLIKQDKKYSGAVKQLAFNTANYELEHNSDYLLSIANPDSIGLFKYLGWKIADKEVKIILDKKNPKKAEVKGIPFKIEKSQMNRAMNLDKYDFLRKFVIIKSGAKSN